MEAPMSTNQSNMKRKVVQKIIQRCKQEGKRAKEIVSELKLAGYKVFEASFCVCEEVTFFDSTHGVQIRVLP